MPEPSAADMIEIRVEHVSQLFNMLDPFPFRERDLDPDAEEYIVGWARELPRTRPIHIVVHLPASVAATREAQGLGEAFAHFFNYRGEVTGRELSELLRIGRRALAIALAVLALCLFLAGVVSGRLGSGPFARFIEEGLIILGWVANWRPLEIFLYEWWPLVRRRRLYRRLAAADVTVRADPRVAGDPAPAGGA